MKLLVAGLVGSAILVGLSAAESAQPARGRELFVRRCSGCHDPEINKEGPRLRGVFGRKAASAPGFAYSDSLRKLSIHWDEASLDRWLQDPDAMAPDSDMAFKLTSADERRDVIAYLKSLGDR